MKFNLLLGMTFFCIHLIYEPCLSVLEAHSVKQLNLPAGMRFNSQAGQDEFVHILLYQLLNKQDKGYYFEVGASDPILINNTYFFEKNYGWNGVSIDIASEYERPWLLNRKNSLLIADAIHADYEAILQSFPKVIDYLTLDIDGYYDTVLEKIPLDNYIFKIITIEHDSYRYGDRFKDKEREILTGYGYHLLCANVQNDGVPFEDWWIHPSAFPSNLLSELTSLDLDSKNYNEIIDIIQTKLELEIFP